MKGAFAALTGPLLLGAILAWAAACGGDGGTLPPAASPDEQEAGRPLVVVSTSILGDIVRVLAGDEATVEVLIPVGTDTHDFQPSARDMTRIRNADLVVVFGLGLEESLGDAVASARADGVPVVELAAELDPLPFRSGDLDHTEPDGDGDNDGEGGLDPHVWLDPVRMARGVELLGERLAAMQPASRADEWRQRAAAYREEIMAVHREIETLVEALPPERRKLVTNHDALGYFAARYGFTITGTVIPGGSTTAAEPSASDLAELLDTIEREGVSTIFAEDVASRRLAESLAEQAGRPVAVVVLYTESLGQPGSGADSYLGFLRTNAELIVSALRE